MRHAIRLLTTLLGIVLATPAMALDARFAGFGTASLSCFGSEAADFVNNDQPEGPGRTRDCDSGLDSMLGVQLDVDLSETFDAGVQLLAERNVEGDFDPRVSVAQLRWHPSATTTVRVGRMPSASFLHAEDRRVRYALPWVRPPLEVYGMLPVFVQDGVDVLHVSPFGTWTGEWHLGVAQSDFEYPVPSIGDTGEVESEAVFGHLLLRRGGTQFKAGYAFGNMTVHQAQLDAFHDLLNSLGPVGQEIADDMSVKDVRTHLLTFGASHERNDWLLMGEFGYRAIERGLRDQFGAYVTVGRRFGPWMPYFTLGRRWTHGDDTDSRAAMFGPQIEAAVEGFLATSKWDSKSLSLGLSRELGRQATLKFQADWVKPDDDSWGLLTNHGPDYDFAHPDSDWLFTLSLDFVF